MSEDMTIADAHDVLAKATPASLQIELAVAEQTALYLRQTARGCRTTGAGCREATERAAVLMHASEIMSEVAAQLRLCLQSPEVLDEIREHLAQVRPRLSVVPDPEVA